MQHNLKGEFSRLYLAIRTSSISTVLFCSKCGSSSVTLARLFRTWLVFRKQHKVQPSTNHDHHDIAGMFSASSCYEARSRGKRVAVKVGDLLSGNECEFETSTDDAEFYEDGENRAELVYDMEALKEHLNFDCLESSDPTTMPFEELEKKMTDIWPDGKVKKRVLKVGTVQIPEDAEVRVHYNCYTEMEEVPFDSSYLRSKRPSRFQLGAGSLFVGFEIALLSMTVGEKAQFLIHPDYAFGILGSPGRIPQDATVMLIAEVFRLELSSGEEPLSVKDRKDFGIAYAKAKALNFEANKCVKDRYLGQAIGYYRRAEDLLVGCSLNSQEEEEKMKKLLIKVYGNMAVCFNSKQINQPKKTCIAVRKAFEMNPSQAAKTAKLFYHRGVAHMALAEYTLARRDLKMALKLLPDDEDIQKQIEALEMKVQSFREFEGNFSNKAFLGFNQPPAHHATLPVPLPDDVYLPDIKDDDCEAAVRRLLEDFVEQGDACLDLSAEYTAAELECLKTECARLNLTFIESEKGPYHCEISILRKPQ